jgi:cytidyltransferase-like protein
VRKRRALQVQSQKFPTAVVFGVFDGLHKGHLFFLRAASRMCGKLIAVIARDSAVVRLKHKKPRMSQQARVRAVSGIPGVAHAVLGDKKDGTYTVLTRYMPGCICLGYDQKALARDLKKKMRAGVVPRVPLLALNAYHPRRYHTSLLSRRGRYAA